MSKSGKFGSYASICMRLQFMTSKSSAGSQSPSSFSCRQAHQDVVRNLGTAQSAVQSLKALAARPWTPTLQCNIPTTLFLHTYLIHEATVRFEGQPQQQLFSVINHVRCP
jgi:hypothetical protein